MAAADHEPVPAAGAAAALSWRQVLETSAIVVGPASLVTGLLFYLGWAHTENVLGHFGLNASVVGASSNDYVLRSVDALFKPAATIAALGIVALWGHVAVQHRLATGGSGRLLRALTAAAAVLGVVALLLGMVGLFQSRRGLFWSLSLSAGALLLGYAALLARRFSALHAGRAFAVWGRSLVVAHSLLLFALVALGLFWSAVNYAAAVGAERGRRIETGIRGLGDVVLFSTQHLGLTGPGVSEEPCRHPDAAFSYRTEGLKLLQRSEGKYFLLPAGWSSDEGSVMVVADSEMVRLEFSAGGFTALNRRC
jgi:hypothetical protein